ncbi:hypothetical protein [Actinocorallia sp. A-T 12471]|uniref:cupredoxin domain-containing protein n=1 Tax=Actinocorallia sp. A-T 12471 TaxID=3089813 RepID=UPI0029CEDEFE|nr:hypothetical protein [Actinocorallia sp. A-T 12471]MDX6742415.1 hypothetical protein [Actinocorallia sp. A-T 12471]
METTTAWHLGLPVTLEPADGDAAGPHETVGLYETGDRLLLAGLPGEGETADLRRFRVRAAAADDLVSVEDDGLATAIRMGKIMVPLYNHAVVEYGVRAGLLALDPAGGDAARVRTSARFRTASRVGPAPDAGDGPAPGERAIYGWYLGMPLVHHIVLPEYYGGTGPSEPSPELPSLRTYITGTVEHQALSSPVRQVPTADGVKTLISHQNTTDIHPGDMPHNSFGFFVLRGPKGDDGNVRVDPCPPDSIPADPLAHQIRIGDAWVRLNHHLVIEYGVETGLLRLEPLEFGGIMTTRFPDVTQMAVEIEPTGVVPLGEMARLTVGTMNLQKMARGNSPVDPAARHVRVSCRSFAFEPAEIRARVGEPLAIELTCEDNPHNFTIDEFAGFVQTGVEEAAVGGFIPDRTGTFEFYCSDTIHRAVGMTGRLVVED